MRDESALAFAEYKSVCDYRRRAADRTSAGLKHTVAPSLACPRANAASLETIRFGLADADSGIDLASLSVSADFVVNGRAPDTQFADLAEVDGEGIWRIALSSPLQAGWNRHFDISVRDGQGNTVRVRCAILVGTADTTFRDGYD